MFNRIIFGLAFAAALIGAGNQPASADQQGSGKTNDPGVTSVAPDFQFPAMPGQRTVFH